MVSQSVLNKRPSVDAFEPVVASVPSQRLEPNQILRADLVRDGRYTMIHSVRSGIVKKPTAARTSYKVKNLTTQCKSKSIPPVPKELTTDFDRCWTSLVEGRTTQDVQEYQHSKHWSNCNLSQRPDFHALALEMAQNIVEGARPLMAVLQENGMTPGGTYPCAELVRIVKTEYGDSTKVNFKIDPKTKRKYFNEFSVVHSLSGARNDGVKREQTVSGDFDLEDFKWDAYGL